MPSRKLAPRPAPRQCSPSAMHTPSPASRTGTSGHRGRDPVAQRKAAPAAMLIGLTVPAASVDRARASRCRPRGSRPRRPWSRRRSSGRPRSKHVLLLGLSVSARRPCAPARPPGRRVRRRSWCRRCRGPGSASAFSAGGCCRVDVGRRDARIRAPAAPGRRGAGRATPGTPVAERRPAGVQRSSNAPAPAAGHVAAGARQPWRSG